jgi:hypothetical protein
MRCGPGRAGLWWWANWPAALASRATLDMADSCTLDDGPMRRSELQVTPADYSLPAADAHPRVEARRLSIRRQADVGRCRAPVRSARTMCCLWVVNATTHVSGASRTFPLRRWPGQISGPETWPTLDAWHHAIRRVLVRPPGTTNYRADLPCALRPGSSVTGPTACVSSRSRARSCDASGQDSTALIVVGARPSRAGSGGVRDHKVAAVVRCRKRVRYS